MTSMPSNANDSDQPNQLATDQPPASLDSRPHKQSTSGATTSDQHHPLPFFSRFRSNLLAFWRQRISSPKQLIALAVVCVLSLLVLLYLIPVTRYGILGQVVTKDVSFLVIDRTTTQPIATATVQFDYRSLTTDSHGQVSFSRIPVGVYRVTASAPGYTTLTQSLKVPIWTTLQPITLQLTESNSYGTNNGNNNGSGSTGNNTNGNGNNNGNGGGNNGGGGNNNNGGGGGGNPGPCNPTGVTKNKDGSYNFAPLHVDSQGVLIDSNNCQVYLVGGNGKEPGYANHSEDPYHVINESNFNYVQTLRRLEPMMNLLRIQLMSEYWVENNIIQGTKDANNPNGLTYQQFAEDYINAMVGYGFYVEIDNCSKEGPCNDFSDVPISDAIQMLTKLGQDYNGNPAVIFEVRNEPPSYDRQTDLAQNLLMLNTVESVNPNSLKVVYADQIDYLISHPKEFYTNSNTIKNLIIDEHPYDGLSSGGRSPGCNEPGYPGDWVQFFAHYEDPIIPFLHARGVGFMFNEWGGNCDYTVYKDYADYNTSITNFAIKYNLAGLSYFYPLVTWPQNTEYNTNWLNPIGQDNHALVAQAYNTILESTQHTRAGMTVAGATKNSPATPPHSLEQLVTSVLAWLN